MLRVMVIAMVMVMMMVMVRAKVRVKVRVRVRVRPSVGFCGRGLLRSERPIPGASRLRTLYLGTFSGQGKG